MSGPDADLTPSRAGASWAQRHKPRASARTQLAMAAAMWTLVGAGLATAGFVWTSGMTEPARALAIVGATLVGAAKARWVLARTAHRITARIETRGDGHCAGGVLAWRSWALVAAMVVAGRLLRATPLPRPVLGVLYLAVGTALLLAATIPWRRWWQVREPSPA